LYLLVYIVVFFYPKHNSTPLLKKSKAPFRYNMTAWVRQAFSYGVLTDVAVTTTPQQAYPTVPTVLVRKHNKKGREYYSRGPALEICGILTVCEWKIFVWGNRLSV
jgi:hypothetical protein